jgi:hypothetical protein
VNFHGANLRSANFGRDNLGGCTQLQGANLQETETRGASFDGAEYDNRTKFPKTLNPQTAGMVFRSLD